MVRMGGFEPPTAWFVARYSIQLSYIRTNNTLTPIIRLNLKEMVRVGGFEPPTAWFVARYSIQLSYTRDIFLLTAIQNHLTTSLLSA